MCLYDTFTWLIYWLTHRYRNTIEMTGDSLPTVCTSRSNMSYWVDQTRRLVYLTYEMTLTTDLIKTEWLSYRTTLYWEYIESFNIMRLQHYYFMAIISKTLKHKRPILDVLCVYCVFLSSLDPLHGEWLAGSSLDILITFVELLEWPFLLHYI